MRAGVWAMALLLLPAAARADVVRLRDGGIARGRLVSQDEREVRVELPDGRVVSFARSEVANIEATPTPERAVPNVAVPIESTPDRLMVYVADGPRLALAANRGRTLCVTPCLAHLEPGEHHLRVSLAPQGPIVSVPAVHVRPGDRIRIDYQDHSEEFRAGLITFVAGLVTVVGGIAGGLIGAFAAHSQDAFWIGLGAVGVGLVVDIVGFVLMGTAHPPEAHGFVIPGS